MHQNVAMNLEVILSFLHSFALFGIFGIGVYFIQRNRPLFGEILSDALNGLLLGLAAFLVTVTPIVLEDGATLSVDAGAGPVILAGVVAGPLGGILAAGLGGVARSIVGISSAEQSIVIYTIYALIGISVHHFGIIDPRTLFKPRVVLVLIAASFCGSAAMFFLIEPYPRALIWLQTELPIIWIVNALSISFAILLLGGARYVSDKVTEVAEINQRLDLAKLAGHFGVWDIDLASGRLFWDDRSKELHGIEDGSFTGTFEDWARNVHPDDLAKTTAAFEEALSGGRVFGAEYRVVLPDGQVKSIKGDAIVLRDPQNKPVRVVGTNQDLTEIRNAQHSLVEAESHAAQSQKFETIGQLTGGVAHDFNNLLAVIMGNLELLRDEIQIDPLDKDEARVLIDASIEATQRGAELTQNMLAYARKARLDPEIVDLNEIVRETKKWMRRTIESSIDIETVFQEGLWSIRADRSSLQSAIVNLIVNARDAMDGAGEVVLRTRNIHVDELFIAERQEEVLPGDYVLLTVDDNGMGIEANSLQKIFDPFYTTKAVGKGTGLGLSMVQGFVKQSGGALRVTSQTGKGTSFELYFPALSEPPVATSKSSFDVPSPLPLSEDRARILLVEDREEVMLVLQKILRASEFDVVTAENGDRAAEIFHGQGPFDLVVTDIVMPGVLQGPALADKIRLTHPDMRFIFLSGYASEAIGDGTGIRPEDIRLMKPVLRTDLLSAVEEALMSRSENA